MARGCRNDLPELASLDDDNGGLTMVGCCSVLPELLLPLLPFSFFFFLFSFFSFFFISLGWGFEKVEMGCWDLTNGIGWWCGF